MNISQVNWVQGQWSENGNCNAAPNMILSFSTPDFATDLQAFYNYNKSFPMYFYKVRIPLFDWASSPT